MAKATLRTGVPVNAPPRPSAQPELHPDLAREFEVVMDGRRYRLMPIDGEWAEIPHRFAHHELTARELQIVTLVARGLVNKQIAAELRISGWTVSTHLRRIYAKLGVDTRAAMVSRCATLLNGGQQPASSASAL